MYINNVNRYWLTTRNVSEESVLDPLLSYVRSGTLPAATCQVLEFFDAGGHSDPWVSDFAIMLMQLLTIDGNWKSARRCPMLFFSACSSMTTGTRPVKPP